MKIYDRNIDIDFLEEISDYSFIKYKIRGSEFQCCSPFRNEDSPSFSLNLETGLWIDYGATDDNYKQGNFIKFLSFLRDEDYHATCNYLLSKYNITLENTEELNLRLNIELKNENTANDISPTNIRDLYSNKLRYTDYFTCRGISEEVQKLFNLGYDSVSNAVAMPWYNDKGKLINIKFRLISDKRFYYLKDGKPIKNYVYGLHLVNRFSIKKVAICESEIDALYLWSNGIPAIALGGSHLSDKQKQQILFAGITEITLATDNDRVGNELAKVLEMELSPHLLVKRIKFITTAKDVNDCTPSIIAEMFNKSATVVPQFIKP